MNSISLFRPNDPYENLISQMIAIERQPQYYIMDERDNQERLKSVMSDVDSMISALHTLTESFTDQFNSPFAGRAATVADNTAFDVTAGDDAALGSHTLEVLRLAKADNRVSEKYTNTGTTLRNFFDSNGSQTFSITIAKPTEADPDNTETVDVTIDPTGDTDDEILAEISAAINTAMDDAIDAETLDNEDIAHASVVNETSSTARLSLRAGKTGFSNKLAFTDSDDNLLDLLEVTRTNNASDTRGGYVTDIGTDETDSLLNSQFILNGLTIYRDGNSITDALTDATITLKKTGEDPGDFTVSADTEGIKSQVNDFISKYNELLLYFQNKSNVDADTGVRGDFAGDATFSSLRYGLRDDISLAVSGQPSAGPTYLTDIGITIDTDGSIELTDDEALIAAVENDAAAVEDLFASAGGIATRIQTRLEAFVGIDGIIDNRTESIETRLKRLNDRIDDWDERMIQKEDQLRQQFAKMQEAIAVMQGQQQYLSNFLYSGTGLY